MCGARLSAIELLDAGEELIDAERGIVAARCPHCQGNLEVIPTAGRLDLGYLTGSGRFEVAGSLRCDGLEVFPEGAGMAIAASGRRWTFAA